MRQKLELALLATLAGALPAAPAAAAPLEWKTAPAARALLQLEHPLLTVAPLPPGQTPRHALVAAAPPGGPAQDAGNERLPAFAATAFLQLTLPPALPPPLAAPRGNESPDIGDVGGLGSRLGPDTRFMLAFGASAPWPGGLRTHTLPAPSPLTLLLFGLSACGARGWRGRR